MACNQVKLHAGRRRAAPPIKGTPRSFPEWNLAGGINSPFYYISIYIIVHCIALKYKIHTMYILLVICTYYSYFYYAIHSNSVEWQIHKLTRFNDINTIKLVLVTKYLANSVESDFRLDRITWLSHSSITGNCYFPRKLNSPLFLAPICTEKECSIPVL